MKAYTPENMRLADKCAMENYGIPGIVLMDRAADALYNELSVHFGKNKKFVILCGKGNNGGDGWALGQKLSEGFENTVLVSVFGEPQSDMANHFYKRCLESSASKLPLKIVYADKNESLAKEEIKNADIIVEAIFGTGFTGEISPDSTVGSLLELANRQNCYKLCADIPCGANAETGQCSKVTFKADCTVSFAKPKPGLFCYPARQMCGKIKIADIGIPECIFEAQSTNYEIADDLLIKNYLPERSENSHKGSFGTLLTYAGSENMPGAACLALSGALRAGAGLVAFASGKYVTDIMKHRLSEPIFINTDDSDKDTDMLVEYSKKCTALLIGCGLGKSDGTKKRVIRLIKECQCPIILDADGINAVSDNINVITEAKKGILLTPHPLEFSRISGIDIKEISASRCSVAKEFAKKYNCTLLLKGAGTIICDKNGKVCIIPISCSALAKGGSGDVLSGIIASFSAQGATLYESAVIGAYLHGKAGIALASEFSEYGVMPSDIPKKAAEILASII